MLCTHSVVFLLIDPHADFNAVKPSHKLDTSIALYRSRMGGTINRKLPSRSHLRKMGSSGDILDNLPKAVLCDLDKPLEDGASTPVASPRPSSVESREVHTPTPQPKPRPRAAPRKKPVDEAEKETKKTPQVAPRNRAPTADNLEAMKSPPRTPGHMKSSEDEKSPPAHESPKHPMAVNDADKLSPAKAPKPLPAGRAPNVGPKPSPKAPGKAPAKDPTADPPAATEIAGDQASPNRSRTGSLEKEPAASDVDPSKLSIKEKALLAQKAFVLTPEKPKPGPPRIAKKPKPTPGTPVRSPETPEEGGLSMESRIRRAQSVEEEMGESPQQQKRKLPPGAINMLRMGALPMFGPGSDRSCSSTVSTSDPVAHERNSAERDLHPQHEENGVEGTDDAPADQRASFHGVPVLPMPKPASAEADLDDSTSPQAPPKFEHKNPDVTMPASPTTKEVGGEEEEFGVEVDLDYVLTWTPDVTAAWLGQVGLGGHRLAFFEKEIHGYMLFDIDGHKLKVRR